MPRGAHDSVVILTRRAEVARRYLQGQSTYKIGEDLGVDRTTISKDLKALREEWVKSANLDFSELQARELAKIDLMEAEAWEEWGRSKRDREIQSGEQKDHNERGREVKTGFRKEGKTGDGEYMRIIQWCINKRCEILGLDAVKKVAFTDPTGKKEYGGIAPGSPLSSLIAGARAAMDRLGPEARPAIDGGTGSQPAAVDPADGPADTGLPVPGG